MAKNKTIGKRELRRFAISVLDDGWGINETSYEILRDLLIKTENDDILDYVDATDGRFYLNEDCVKALSKGL